METRDVGCMAIFCDEHFGSPRCFVCDLCVDCFDGRAVHFCSTERFYHQCCLVEIWGKPLLPLSSYTISIDACKCVHLKNDRIAVHRALMEMANDAISEFNVAQLEHLIDSGLYLSQSCFSYALPLALQNEQYELATVLTNHKAPADNLDPACNLSDRELMAKIQKEQPSLFHLMMAYYPQLNEYYSSNKKITTVRERHHGLSRTADTTAPVSARSDQHADKPKSAAD